MTISQNQAVIIGCFEIRRPNGDCAPRPHRQSSWPHPSSKWPERGYARREVITLSRSNSRSNGCRTEVPRLPPSLPGLTPKSGVPGFGAFKIAKVGNIRLWCNPSLCEDDGPPELGCSLVLAL